MKNNTALLACANGAIGSNLISYLSTLENCGNIGMARPGGQNTTNIKYIPIDLLDPENYKKQLHGLTQVSHIFYAAYQDA